jgi:crotonobetainyl-CoA:carnitine CoA-transferase CaiB-like acyl-CoA transferase
VPVHGLRDLRVIDFSTGIAGPYCTKLLADAGADVIGVEAPEGDPLRGWSASGADLGGADGALFQFLHLNKRSVVGRPHEPAVRELVAGADLVVESFAGGAPEPRELQELRARHPGLVLLSISGFGRSGPFAERPWSEFTLQAECGSLGTRGLPGQEPFQCGGRTTEWVAGTFAAVAALAALWRARRSGHGGHVDFSVLEVMTLAGTNYMDLIHRLLGAPDTGGRLPQSVETPSVEPSADGYVGFCTNSRQQFSDFLLLIERSDLADDAALAQVAGRMARFAEWNEIVHAWTRRHTTAEIVERASLLRIPVAPVLDGKRVLEHEQLVARGVFREEPRGSFRYPRPPWIIAGEQAPPARPAPRLGEHTGRVEARAPRRPAPAGEAALPLAGLRVLDLTAWWAGPAATQMLALLGAEVIHVEACRRPDGMRMVGGMLAGKYPEWWECSHFFLAANANKQGLALDLSTERGRELLRGLVAVSDALFDNFTPRVLEGFGLSWEAVHALNPQAILVRMPAFGLSGPWRDHTGFAQTMEQITGLAWLTGQRDDQPRIQRGPCDPLAGMHAAFAFLVALAEREARGEGVPVECAMVEGALNAAAEQVLEYSAYGRLLEREGNRAPHAAPQGLYPCRGSEPGAERWLALSVEGDAHWQGLCRVLGRPDWARDPALASLRGRRAAHDALDARLRPWFAAREREKCVEELVAEGVPAAPVADPRHASQHPQMAARGFYEELAHPVVGRQPIPGAPFRFASVPRWLRSPAPLLGQHNREVLGRLLGLSAPELERLEAEGVIGTRPLGL